MRAGGWGGRRAGGWKTEAWEEEALEGGASAECLRLRARSRQGGGESSRESGWPTSSGWASITCQCDWRRLPLRPGRPSVLFGIAQVPAGGRHGQDASPRERDRLFVYSRALSATHLHFNSYHHHVRPLIHPPLPPHHRLLRPLPCRSRPLDLRQQGRARRVKIVANVKTTPLPLPPPPTRTSPFFLPPSPTILSSHSPPWTLWFGLIGGLALAVAGAALVKIGAFKRAREKIATLLQVGIGNLKGNVFRVLVVAATSSRPSMTASFIRLRFQYSSSATTPSRLLSTSKAFRTASPFVSSPPPSPPATSGKPSYPSPRPRSPPPPTSSISSQTPGSSCSPSPTCASARNAPWAPAIGKFFRSLASTTALTLALSNGSAGSVKEPLAS
ncbi:hypothetical protein C8R43DRAFT_373533 [Mycena crocata]|nr:hypothetical protein C8R43DRAFT_373533 [Mycena crocata]